MPAPCPTVTPITVEEIEEALVYAAYLVEKYGDAYAPILNRLDREFEAACQKESPRDRARRILDKHAAEHGQRLPGRDIG